jgi:hypothetical protein
MGWCNVMSKAGILIAVGENQMRVTCVVLDKGLQQINH